MQTRGLLFFVFLASFFFALSGSSPTLDGGDSGELIASAHVLGIPHAPGYPTYQVLAKAVQTAVPFSSISYRSHVLSALLGSATLVLFGLLMLKITGSSVGAAVSTLFLATRPLFIEQSRVVEVFMLNALFAVAILILVSRQSKRDIVAALFLLGVGFGNHHTLLVLVPILMWFTWKTEFSVGETVAAGFFFLAGASVYLVLPIRAHMDPAVNFGDPETWTRFWAVVTRKEFGSFSLHPAAVPFRDAAVVYEQVLQTARRFVHHLGPNGIAVALAGLIIGIRKPEFRRWTLIAFAGWIVLGFGFELYSNLSPFSDIGQWRLERFLLIPLVSAAFLAAMAVKLVPGAWKTAPIVLLTVQAIWSAPLQESFRSNFGFRDLGISLLRCAPLHSKFVIDQVLFDEPTSSLLVLTQVENKRPDIEFFYRPGTLFKPVYGEDILGLSRNDRAIRQQQVELQRIVSSTDPVRCLAFERVSVPFKEPALEGLLYKPGVSRTLPILVDRGRYALAIHDYPTRLIRVHFPYFAGKQAIESGDIPRALSWFNSATRLGPDMAWLASNIGGLYVGVNRFDEARRSFSRSVANDAYFYEGNYGMGFMALQERNFPQAISWFEKATKMAPDRPEGYYMLGLTYAMKGDKPKAKAPWDAYLKLRPHGKMADDVRREMSGG